MFVDAPMANPPKKRAPTPEESRAIRLGGARSANLNIRITDQGWWVIHEMQQRWGLSQGQIIEMLLREEARRQGWTIPGSNADRVLREKQKALEEKMRGQNPPEE